MYHLSLSRCLWPPDQSAVTSGALQCMLLVRTHTTEPSLSFRPLQGSARTAKKPASKIQKPAKKERLRQKRKRVAAAAAAGSAAGAEANRERNLRYYVETAKADAEVQKLMREVRLVYAQNPRVALVLDVSLELPVDMRKARAYKC